jgi:hypothetical protein
VRQIAAAILAITLLLASGCDPGMTIRQARSSDQPASRGRGLNPEVTIAAKTSHPIVGHTWYDPQLRITRTFWRCPVLVVSQKSGGRS